MPKRIAGIALVIACLLTLSGCGKEADEGFKTVSSAPKRTAQVACTVEYGVVNTARDAYIALNGQPPTRTSDLGQILAKVPTYIEVEPDGSLGLTAKARQMGCELPSADAGGTGPVASTNSTNGS